MSYAAPLANNGMFLMKVRGEHLFISHQASPNALATINILPTLAAIESPNL